jgi:hypothetical protein
MKERFDDFLPQCGAYLLIKTPLLEKRYKNVIAIVNDNNIEYWDSNNQRMSYITRDEEEELIKYEEMLSDTAVEKINTYNEMNENKKYNNKHIVSLTEKDLCNIIKESLKKIYLLR